MDVLTKMFDLLYKVVSHAICQSPRRSLGANIITLRCQGRCQGSSPLLVGAKYGNVEVVRLLVKDERVDLGLQDNLGR